MSLTFSPAELVDLTRYTRASKQLAVLHLRGFHRAYIDHTNHVVLERAHYEAVCRGEAQPVRPRVKPPARPQVRAAA
ncbi:DUF4224 domain-containing protein [Roseateles sp. P5_E7]